MYGKVEILSRIQRTQKKTRDYLHTERKKIIMAGYSPFYTFLTYLQLASIILTFVALIVAIIGGILGIKALLIYIKKNREPKTEKVTLEKSEPGAFDGVDREAESDGSDNGASAEKPEEVEAEIVFDPAAEEDK